MTAATLREIRDGDRIYVVDEDGVIVDERDAAPAAAKDPDAGLTVVRPGRSRTAYMIDEDGVIQEEIPAVSLDCPLRLPGESRASRDARNATRSTPLRSWLQQDQIIGRWSVDGRFWRGKYRTVRDRAAGGSPAGTLRHVATRDLWVIGAKLRDYAGIPHEACGPAPLLDLFEALRDGARNLETLRENSGNRGASRDGSRDVETPRDGAHKQEGCSEIVTETGEPKEIWAWNADGRHRVWYTMDQVREHAPGAAYIRKDEHDAVRAHAEALAEQVVDLTGLVISLDTQDRPLIDDHDRNRMYRAQLVLAAYRDSVRPNRETEGL